MQTVLLAIDGATAHRATIDFAVRFCRRMQTKLEVLQILRPQPNQPATASGTPNVDPEAFANASFVHMERPLQSDDPDQAVASYVQDHRNVVLAIYDTDHRKESIFGSRRRPNHVHSPLAVPLVMLRKPTDS